MSTSDISKHVALAIIFLSVFLATGCNRSNPVQSSLGFTKIAYTTPDLQILLGDPISNSTLQLLTWAQVPVFSPREHKLVYLGDSSGYGSCYYLYDLASGSSKCLTQFVHNGAGFADVCWSSDGSRIIYSSPKGGVSDIYMYDFSSLTETKLTNQTKAYLPAVSFDGRTIVFLVNTGINQTIGVVNVDGTAFKVLDVGGTAGPPGWLPNGRILCGVKPFDKPISGYMDLYSFNPDGSNPIQLSSDHHTICNYSQVFDQSNIAVESSVPDTLLDSTSVDLINFNTGVRQKWISLPDKRALGVLLSPDKHWLAYIVSNPPGFDLFMISTDTQSRVKIASNTYGTYTMSVPM